jgi:Uma2 family endonuclease
MAAQLERAERLGRRLARDARLDGWRAFERIKSRAAKSAPSSKRAAARAAPNAVLTTSRRLAIMVSMSATSPLPRLHTYGDLRRWSDEFRWELIDGQAHAMTGPSWQHQRVCMNLSSQLNTHFNAHGCRVFAAPFDIRLPEADEHDDAIRTVVQPDISVICDASKLDSRGCRGAPDLVVEILSPSTAARDHVIKRALYERHGVREYWLVHPLDRILTIYTYRGETGFGPVELLAATGKLTSPGFPELEIDWDEVFADVSAEP